MTELDPELFGDPPARDHRFEVKQVWSEMENIYDDAGRMLTEFMHRQMNEEVNGIEICARNLTDFPDAPWELRMAVARQAWDEARHVEMFRRSLESRGGRVGQFPVLNFEYRMITHIPTLIGRLAVHERLKGRGCGALLLMDALHRSLAHAAEIAAMAVVVDAKDEAAVNFYRHFDFQPLQREARRMYLPMKTVAALLG